MSKLVTELKPLVATLREIQFGGYLQSDSFENLMLKNNLDEIWHAAIGVINPQDTIYIGDTYVHEESFIFCIHKLWEHDRQMFYLFVTTTISGLIRYAEPTEDLSELIECLEKLEFPHKNLNTINETIKKRQDTSSQALKSVKMQSKYEDPCKIFISHSSKDKNIVEAFVEDILQLGLGIPHTRIFCTSIEGQGVDSGEYIPDRLRSEMKRTCIALLFISDTYKKSEVCLNEVGAAWVTLEKKHVIPILLPNVGFDKLGFLNFNKLTLRIHIKDDLLKFVDDAKEVLEVNVKNEKLNKQLDKFLNKIKSLSVNNGAENITATKRKPDEWTECYTNNLIPFNDILRQAIPEKSHGIYEISDVKTQNKIMSLLAEANFLQQFWYKTADGDGYVENIKRLPSGNWSISSSNWEIKISTMWVSKGTEPQNDFVLIKSERLDPYKINSDVGGEDYVVGVLKDGSTVSQNEYSNGYANFNGDTVKLSDYDVEVRNREPEPHWIFFASYYHKVGYNSDETLAFCKELDNGEIQVSISNLQKLLHSLRNHPTVLKYR